MHYQQQFCFKGTVCSLDAVCDGEGRCTSNLRDAKKEDSSRDKLLMGVLIPLLVVLLVAAGQGEPGNTQLPWPSQAYLPTENAIFFTLGKFISVTVLGYSWHCDLQIGPWQI